MTRGERLLSGRMASWMDGVKSGSSATTADPSRWLTRGERLLSGRVATWMDRDEDAYRTIASDGASGR
jgi:hypothetical protein